jgi:hypothetical protein
MKTVIALFVFLSASLTSNAQLESIAWSEEFKDRGYYSLIGESQDAFFAERKYNTSSNDRDADLELLRFNQDLNLTHTVQLKDIEKGSYASIATVNSPEGLAHIYYQTSKNGEHYISAQLFSHDDLRKTEIIDLAKFKINDGSRWNATQDRDFQYSYPLDIVMSKDKTKLAIIFDQEQVGKKDRNFYQYSIVDLSAKFQILFEGSFYSDDSSDKYSTSARHLSNSGKLTYAIKKYVKNNSTEHINKKPAYDYEIHHMTGDSTEYIYDIKIRKEYIDKLTIGSDSEDNLYISGYIRKQPFGDIKKSFLLGLDPLGYERYSVKEEYTRRDVKKIVGKENNKLDENFQTIEVLPTDNIVYIIRQYRRRGSNNTNMNNSGFNRNRYNQFNTREYYWNYDEVVIEGVGKETGEVLWTTVNMREQEDNDTYSRYFITGQIEVLNNNLLLIYNEREENIQRILRKDDDLKRTDIPGDKTAITLAMINPSGKLKYKVLNEENNFHLPTKGVHIGVDSIYYFSQHKNYKNFYVGKSSTSLFEF